MTGRNPRTIRRALDRLEQAGIIAGDHRHGRVTRWRLPIEPYIESCPQPRAPTPSVSAEDLGSPRPTPEGPHALGGRVPTPYESVLEPVLEPGPRTDAAQMRALAEAARIEAKALEDARRAESKVLDELDPPRRARPAGA
jgi:hypothetical protein